MQMGGKYDLSSSVGRLQQDLIRIDQPQLFLGYFLNVLLGLDVDPLFLQGLAPPLLLFQLSLQPLLLNLILSVLLPPTTRVRPNIAMRLPIFSLLRLLDLDPLLICSPAFSVS